MNFLSVCSGIEAASVAWTPLGWRACMASEIKPFPIAVLRHRHGAHDLRRTRPAGPHLPLWGDFTALRVRHFRRFGIPLPEWLVGGTPCQSFSVAGHRRSLDDARGNLSLAFIRLAHALARTGALRGSVWENVPGVLSTSDNAFGCFLGELVGGGHPLLPPGGGSWPRAGMVSGPRARAAWRVLDAQYFGLAQRRERLFLVASFGDGPDPAAILFERQGLHGNPAPRREAGARATVGTLGGTSPGGGWRFGADEAAAGQLIATASGEDIAPCLIKSMASSVGNTQDAQIIAVAFDCKAGGDTSFAVGPIAGALRGEGHGGGHAAVAFQENQRGELTTSETASALKGGGGKPGQGYPAAATASGVRRLTPRECERLQGFPDDYTLVPMDRRTRIAVDHEMAAYYRRTRQDLSDEDLARLAADGPRYKALGNSKPVPVVRWIGERIAAAMTAVPA